MGLDRRITSFVELQLENYNDRAKIDAQRSKLIQFAKSTETPTENAAIWLVSDIYLKYTDLCREVIEAELNKLDVVDRCLIQLLYFDKSHTVTGAGAVVGLSPAQAYRHRNLIIARIAQKLGYIPSI